MHIPYHIIYIDVNLIKIANIKKIMYYDLMSALKNLKPAHAAFVREYVQNGFNGAQAYLKIKPCVAYATANVNASKLLSQANIKCALNEIVEKASEKSIASRQFLIQEAHEIGQEARQKGQYNPALTAIDLKAKLNRIYDRDTPDLESYTQVMQQFIQVNQVNQVTVSPTAEPTPQPIDITPLYSAQEVGNTNNINELESEKS